MLEDSDEMLPLDDAVDVQILMHRDVHFGGKFPIMIEYYENGGKGVLQDFEIQRIKDLALIEEETQQNLAPLMLKGPEAEKVGRAIDAYRKLRSLYEEKNPSSPYPKLIADLILSEEEHPEKEIEAIVKHKHKVIPALVDLIRSEDFRDPLFPGYGLAPSLAAECLGLIGDKRGIVNLFEMIGTGDFFEDEGAVHGLLAIGQPAKEFLLKVLKINPLSEDNERAAIALIHFKEDPEVAKTCFHVLQSLDMTKETILAGYLILACEGLPIDSKEWSEFQELAKKAPKNLKQDFEVILKKAL